MSPSQPRHHESHALPTPTPTPTPSPSPSPSPTTVVVLRFSSLGDIILTSAAVDALAYQWPQARIVFATKQVFAPVAARLPHVDEVVALAPRERLGAFRRRLREAHARSRGDGPLAVLDLHGKVRSLLLRGIASRRHRSVWTKRGAWQALAVRLLRRPYRAHQHIAARYHGAVERLVGRACARGQLGYCIDPAEAHALSRLLAGHGVAADDPVVGISPGALWATKRWPAASFAELSRRLLAQGWRVVLTGSPAEAELNAGIAAAAPGAINLVGQLGLGALAALIDRCRAFVANDSGPMHLARALCVPTLTFFGSTDPAQFDFAGHGLRYLGLDCSPCSFHGLAACPKGHLRCLNEIGVDATWDALQPLLGRGRVAPVSG